MKAEVSRGLGIPNGFQKDPATTVPLEGRRTERIWLALYLYRVPHLSLVYSLHLFFFSISRSLSRSLLILDLLLLLTLLIFFFLFFVGFDKALLVFRRFFRRI